MCKMQCAARTDAIAGVQAPLKNAASLEKLFKERDQIDFVDLQKLFVFLRMSVTDRHRFDMFTGAEEFYSSSLPGKRFNC